MKKKSVAILLVALCLICLTCVLCACGKGKDSQQSHEHSYTLVEAHDPTCTESGNVLYYTCTCGKFFDSEKREIEESQTVVPATGHDKVTTSWESDGISHWRKCNKCDDRLDEAKHTVITDNAVDANCTEPGKTEGSHCEVCSKVFVEQHDVDALGHDYKMTWTSDDNINALIVLTCQRDNTHVYRCNGTVVTDRTEATCEADGEIRYTVTIEYDSKTYTDTHTQKLDKLNHNYSIPKWTWTEDKSSATLELTCANDENHKISVSDVTVSNEERTNACAIEVIYTATASYNGQTYSDTQIVTKDGEHNYLQPTWTWNDDHSQATAHFVCERNYEHILDLIDSEIDVQTQSANCTNNGKITYTASVEVYGKSYTTNYEETILAGHKYEDDPVWDWFDNYSSATAKFTCSVCHADIQEVEANEITNIETPATCNDTGSIVYTAKVQFNEKEYTDMTTKVLEALGHTYRVDRWEWSQNHETATVHLVCENNKDHIASENASVQMEREEASCTVNGSITYTATVRFNDQDFQDTFTETILASHTFGKWVNTKEPDCTQDGKKRQQCALCGELYGDEENIDALGHDFNTAWQHDDDEHWHKCSRCDATDDHIAHTLNDEGECSVCDYAAETPANEFAFSAASNGSWMLTSYNGHRSSVAIPSQYYGQPVTVIDVEAFYNNKTLLSLTVPETVEKIESRAFSGCGKLQTVVLPSNLTSIADDAFEGCGAIENVTYPSMAIGSVPKENLVTIHITNGAIPANTYKDRAKLKYVILDATVTEIGASAFENCTSIAQIIVPDSVTTIGKAAFGGCSGLEQLTIPFVGGNSAATGASASTLFGYIFSEGSFDGGTRTLQHFSSSDTAVYYIPSKLAKVTVTSKDLLHGAFYNCNMLAEVSFGDEVTAIGDEAFFSCQNLQTVNFPKQLDSIGYSAFAYCVKISEINVPESIRTIGKKAFDVTSWFNAQNDGTIYIQHVLYQYKGAMPAGTTITIEDGTASITAEAFLGCSNLTTLNIPSTIQTYGEKAFEGCDNITNATLPASAIAHITNTNLETVEITTGDIPQDTFRSQNKLERLTIGSGVYSIGNTAFAYCSSLTTVNWNAINCTKVGIFEAGSSSRYDKDNTIFLGCDNITVVNVGDNIRTIPQYAFYKRDSVTTVNVSSLKVWLNISFGNEYANPLYYGAKLYVDGEILPSELKLQDEVGCVDVEPYSFCGYQWISSVDIGGNFKYISKYAFYHCNNLIQVKISDLVDDIGDHAFADCSGLKTISLGDRVTTIRSFAFQNCNQLTTVTIPDSINSIGEGILQGCNSIESVYIPAKSFKSIYAYSVATNGVENISHGFGYIFGIKTLKTTGTKPNTSDPYAQNYEGEIYSGIYDRTSKSYGSTQYTYTCYYYLIPSSLNTVILTSGEKIEPMAFYNCEQLQSISIPDGVTSIGKYAFSGCKGLQTVTIGSGVQSIDRYAFSGCTNITKVNYLGTLKSWCEEGFMDSYSDITNPLYAVNAGTAKLYVNDEEVTGDVNIPAGTTKIGYAAFCGLIGITSVTIPESVTNINERAFSGCTGLTSITIPDSVHYIDQYAFFGCTNITKVNYLGTLKGWCEIGGAAYPLSGGNNVKLYLNEVLVTEVKDLDGLTQIPYYAFYGLTDITSVTIPESVTNINERAFSGCTGLTSITIPDSVHYIDRYAFSGCTGLQTATINAQSIGGSAFYECKGLQEVTIGESVTYIGESAFQNCTNLETVTFSGESKLYEIRERAFKNCDHLTAIIIPASVSQIYNGAFEGCTMLKDVAFEDPTGWNVWRDIPEKQLRDHATAAELLTTTYANYVWDHKTN